jgi:hypothetical protein
MDNPPAAYQPYLEQLIAFATAEARKPDLLTAKAEYFERTGEIFEDDKQFEMRMASFLDYYLFDRRSPLTGQTPAQELYDDKQKTAPQDLVVAFRTFTETVHGLFEVRKVGKGRVRLRDIATGKDHEVTERRQTAGLEKGDILEARLIPFGGLLLFSAAFCYHPRGASKSIIKEAKRRRKATPGKSPQELVWDCAKRSLKVDRYRQIAVEKIYDFENKTI